MILFEKDTQFKRNQRVLDYLEYSPSKIDLPCTIFVHWYIWKLCLSSKSESQGEMMVIIYKKSFESFDSTIQHLVCCNLNLLSWQELECPLLVRKKVYITSSLSDLSYSLSEILRDHFLLVRAYFLHSSLLHLAC